MKIYDSQSTICRDIFILFRVFSMLHKKMLEILQGRKEENLKHSVSKVLASFRIKRTIARKTFRRELRNRCLGSGIVNCRRYRRRTAKNKVTSSEHIERASEHASKREHPQPLTQFDCRSSINVTGTNSVSTSWFSTRFIRRRILQVPKGILFAH